MTTPTLQDHLTDLADPIRGRILLALEGHELSVSELQTILQLPQSTVSRHLKVLSDGGWLARRVEGTSHRYRFDRGELPEQSLQVYELVRDDVARNPVTREDRRRTRTVLAERHTRSRTFFASEAGRWDQLRTELFGRRPELLALLGLIDPAWVVGDLGCGAGHLAAAMAPFARRVIAVDESKEMLRAAGERVAGFDNVEVREGELELLPVSEAELDVAVLAMVLPYVPEPGRVLGEAARALQPGGRLLLLDLQRLERAEYEQTMGHLWLGFLPGQIQEWLTGAGLVSPRLVALPPDPDARGPGLFAATARKPS